MREKYRAWVKSEKRYIVDTQDFIPLIVTNKGAMKLQPQFEEAYYEILPSDWFIIEQSTGLHDKNGVEIYENDIVKFENVFSKEPHVGTVRYYANAKPISDSGKTSVDLAECNDNDLEVIGNIHEKE